MGLGKIKEMSLTETEEDSSRYLTNKGAEIKDLDRFYFYDKNNE